MRKILLIVAVAAVGVLIYLTTDESLSTAASELSRVAATDELIPSRAYRILLGMHAAEDDDAFEVGSQLMVDYKNAAMGAGVLDEIEYPEYSNEGAIYVPSDDEQDLYCRITDIGCLDQVLLNSSGRDAERKRLHKLVERYSAYLSTDDFRSELEASVKEEWPYYRYLVVANRMTIFEAFGTAENGDGNAAIAGLLKGIRRLRTKLVASDTIIHKLITVGLLRDNLEAVAYIHAVYDAPIIAPLTPLTTQELSFDKALKNEFSLVYRIVLALDGSPELLSYEFDTPAWLGHLVFRPNKLLNVVADRIDRQIKLSQVEPASFSMAINEISPRDSRFYSVIPKVNEAMTDMSDVDYTEYIGRTFDLNVKIALVNAQITGDPESLENPYYPGDEVVLHNGVDDGLIICMDGPLPDEKHVRCLDIVGIPDQLVSKIVE